MAIFTMLILPIHKHGREVSPFSEVFFELFLEQETWGQRKWANWLGEVMRWGRRKGEKFQVLGKRSRNEASRSSQMNRNIQLWNVGMGEPFRMYQRPGKWENLKVNGKDFRWNNQQWVERTCGLHLSVESLGIKWRDWISVAQQKFWLKIIPD